MTKSGTVNYVPVEEAKTMSGLRVAFVRGVPGAWGVAIKAILDLKGIDYVAVAHMPGEPNDVLRAWSGQTSAPVAMYNDDRPRPHWSEMLVLAEQLQPEPPLIPADEDERMAMFGICHEICSEDGLGWNVRQLLLSGERAPEGGADNSAARDKYKSPTTNDHARQRVSQIVGALARRLDRQAARGSRYFMGDGLTAVDIYWAAFSNLLSAMDEDLCTMPEFYRGLGPIAQLHLETPLPQILLDHRDYVTRKYFLVPILM